MKYQDLCIKLGEILRAKGINTIYFEDVNLLNSEDVIYPAAVVQLVRVEQESHSDRYTIMVTVAEKRVTRVAIGGRERVYPFRTNNFGWGFYANSGTITWSGTNVYTTRALLSPIYINSNFFLFFSEDVGITTIVVRDDTRIVPWVGNTYRYFNSLTAGSIIDLSQYTGRFLRLSCNIQDNVDGVYYEVESNSPIETYAVTDLRGITDILANDERIQINSCVTTPFRWKFRDEVEGITAEINLSLFFDSNCN